MSVSRPNAAAHAEPFITFNDVSIRLGERIVFEGLDWEIRSNQHWAVIGPNGSGKSTLMKALCGSLPVVNGRIVYHFAEDREVGAHDRIAYVTFDAQRKALGPDAFYQERWNVGVTEDGLGVSEFLSEQGVRRMNFYHVVENEPDATFAQRKQRVVEALDLEPLTKRNVVQLSNGERRKVSIARALLKEPRLLILDNPFEGLDERFRAKLAENLESLMQSEMRLMIVGTSRDEIPNGITHLLSLQRSRVVAQGPWRSGAIGHAEKHALSFAESTARPGGEPNEPNRMPLVEMKSVSVSYNGTPILQQVDWTVREDERWALFGPNGAGKTTLLSLILADNPQAYANDVTLFGKRRGSGESIWEIKQNIGWMAPELQLYYPQEATCLDVVCSGWFDSVGLYRRRTPEQVQIARAWLERFDLAERAATAFSRVSEGEQRLVLLARALVKEPALLVLDEPCQGLDQENRDRVLKSIEGSGSRPNQSMIFVTHRADELPRNITHVIRLSEGRVINQASRRE